MGKVQDKQRADLVAAMFDAAVENILEDLPNSINAAAVKNGLAAFSRFLRETDTPPSEAQVRALLRILTAGTDALCPPTR